MSSELFTKINKKTNNNPTDIDYENSKVIQRKLVFVMHLPKKCMNKKVITSYEWFGKFGGIKKVTFNSRVTNKTGSVAAFIEYYTEKAAINAIQSLHKFRLNNGHEIWVRIGCESICPSILNNSNAKCPDYPCYRLHYLPDNISDIIPKKELIHVNKYIPKHPHQLLTENQLRNVTFNENNSIIIHNLSKYLYNRTILPSKKWFGQFGEIKRMELSVKLSYRAQITYFNSVSALKAIDSMDGYILSNGNKLKIKIAIKGSKYCPLFIKGYICEKTSCLYAHQWINMHTNKLDINDAAKTKANANANATDNDNKTQLKYKVQSGHGNRKIRTWMKKKADNDVTDNVGTGPDGHDDACQDNDDDPGGGDAYDATDHDYNGNGTGYNDYNNGFPDVNDDYNDESLMEELRNGMEIIGKNKYKFSLSNLNNLYYGYLKQDIRDIYNGKLKHVILYFDDIFELQYYSDHSLFVRSKVYHKNTKKGNVKQKTTHAQLTVPSVYGFIPHQADDKQHKHNHINAVVANTAANGVNTVNTATTTAAINTNNNHNNIQNGNHPDPDNVPHVAALNNHQIADYNQFLDNITKNTHHNGNAADNSNAVGTGKMSDKQLSYYLGDNDYNAEYDDDDDDDVDEYVYNKQQGDHINGINGVNGVNKSNVTQKDVNPRICNPRKLKFDHWLLNVVRLKQYLKLFEENGYDDIAMIEFLDIDTLQNELGIKKLHCKLLNKHIQEFKYMMNSFQIFLDSNSYLKRYKQQISQHGILTKDDLKTDIKTVNDVQKILGISDVIKSSQLLQFIHRS